MAKGDIYLGESGSEVLLSPFGRKFTISDSDIKREERTASGRLVREIITTKKRFRLDYETITGTALAVLDGLYAIGDELNLKVYTGVSTYDSYTVLMEPYDRTRLVLLDDGIWTGVSVELSEV